MTCWVKANAIEYRLSGGTDNTNWIVEPAYGPTSNIFVGYFFGDGSGLTNLHNGLNHHEAIRTKIPMIIYPYAAGAPGATWQFIVEAAQAANTNGFVKHGYDTIVMQCGAFSTNRDSNGNIQLDHSRFSIGVTNLVAMLATNGCKLGVQVQYSSVDNDTNCDCSSYVNGGPMMMIGPTNAYRDGFTIGSWGVRHIWVGNPGDGNNELLLRYITETFLSGLYSGAVAVDLLMPSADTTFASSWPHYTWLPEDYNMIYTDPG